MSIKIDNPVLNFASFTPIAAQQILYAQVLEKCRDRGVYLSSYGNHTGMHSKVSLDQYWKLFNDNCVLNVQKVQIVFKHLQDLIKPAKRISMSTSELSEKVTEKCGEFADGEIIAAMILLGYTARFGMIGNPLKIRCEFNAVIKI